MTFLSLCKGKPAFKSASGHAITGCVIGGREPWRQMIRVYRLALFVANQITVHHDPVLYRIKRCEAEAYCGYHLILAWDKFTRRLTGSLQISWLNVDR
jgi:hypothetical protein